MEFTFLGTSSGTPTIQRNVSGLALKLSDGKSWYLIDCGEATQHQLLKTPLSLNSLNGVFITHVHGDHCYGLPGLLASAAMHGRRDRLEIVAPEGVEEFVRAALQFTDMFLPYEVIFTPVEELLQGKELDDSHLLPVLLSHRVPSYGYCFTEHREEKKLLTEKLLADGIPKGPLWGEIQKGLDCTLGDGRVIKADHYLDIHRFERRIVVGGDNDTPGLLSDVCQGADVLVHEATYTQAVANKVGPGPQHSHAAAVAKFAEAAGVQNLVLTHFSARYHASAEHLAGANIPQNAISELADEARAFYSGNLYLAEDFQCYQLGLRCAALSVTDGRKPIHR